MNDSRNHDEQLLIDYVLGEAEEPESIRRRIEENPQFAALYADIRKTFGAMALVPELEPPEDLVDRTLQRIGAAQRTRQLIEREELTRRKVFRPTFSLRELSAVAAVALVLVAVFVPSLRQARQRSLRGECAAQAGQIGHALGTYAASFGDVLPFTESSTSRWLPAKGQSHASPSRSLFKLIQQDYASPVWFQCPAVGGSSFVVQAGQTDFPDGKYISYSYQHSVGGSGISRSDPDFQSHASEMAILADDTPLFENGLFHPERIERPVSRNHDGLGQNVLFLDGHVKWSSEPYVGVGNDNIYLVEGVQHYTGTERPRDKTDTFLLPAFGGR
jgi:prepilin-type processing-associated H-X9-DG protein